MLNIIRRIRTTYIVKKPIIQLVSTRCLDMLMLVNTAPHKVTISTKWRNRCIANPHSLKWRRGKSVIRSTRGRKGATIYRKASKREGLKLRPQTQAGQDREERQVTRSKSVSLVCSNTILLLRANIRRRVPRAWERASIAEVWESWPRRVRMLITQGSLPTRQPCA